MKLHQGCALALALSMGMPAVAGEAPAEPSLDLAPLVPPKPPWMEKKKAVKPPLQRRPGSPTGATGARKGETAASGVPEEAPAGASPDAAHSASKPAKLARKRRGQSRKSGGPEKPAEPGQALEAKPGAAFVAAPPPALSLPALPDKAPAAAPAAPPAQVRAPAEPAPSRSPAPPSEVAAPPVQAARPADVPAPPLVQAQQAPEAPPLLKLSYQTGVLFQNADPTAGLDAVASAAVAEGLRGVARAAPLAKDAALLKATQPCADDACLVALGSAQKLDQVLAAIYTREGKLRVRLVDIAARKTVSEATKAGVSSEPDEAVAVAESLACKLLIPTGCTGEVLVDSASELSIDIDGVRLARGDKRTLPVGLHQLRAKFGVNSAERVLAIVREEPQRFTARLDGTEPRLTSPRDRAARPVVASALSAPSSATAASSSPPERTWAKRTSVVALGVGAAAAVGGALFGARSHSQLDQAESSYRQNGGVFRAADLDALHSGNSSAKTANLLFVTAGVLAGAGLLFALAF